jgi:RNA polymerase sigma factor (sigma-70 family)
MRESDHARIEAARGGDERALRSLLEVYRPDVRRYARRLCQSEDVEEAVQETLWVLWSRIGSLRTVAAFTGWVFRIVQHECLRRARRTARDSGLALDVLHSMQGWEAASEFEMRLDVAAALAALSTEHREVVLLCDVFELTANEAAERLSISVQAVKSRLHRARLHLRSALQAKPLLAETRVSVP